MGCSDTMKGSPGRKSNKDFHVASKVEVRTGSYPHVCVLRLTPRNVKLRYSLFHKSTKYMQHTTSTIISQALTLHENDFANQPTSEFKALVVDEIDEESLVHDEQLRRKTKPVPVRLMKITTENLSQMAILS